MTFAADRYLLILNCDVTICRLGPRVGAGPRTTTGPRAGGGPRASATSRLGGDYAGPTSLRRDSGDEDDDIAKVTTQESLGYIK